MRLAAQRTLLLAAFTCLAAALCLTPISNNDIWLHLTTGGRILDTLAVPRVEEYTFTRAGTPIVDHEWLAQVLFALTKRLSGLAGLSFLKLAVFGATLALLHGSARRRAGSSAAAAAATLWAALMIATHLFTRPHLFTFLLAALFCRLAPRTDSPDPRARRLTFAILLAAMVLWVNLHGGFVTGILIVALDAAGRSIERRRVAPSAALPLLLAGAALLNPYGFRIFRLVGEFSDPVFRESIVEWKSPFTSPFVLTPLFWVYAAWLAALAPAVVWSLRRRRFADALSACVFAVLSIVSRRHVSVLAVVTAPLLAEAGMALARRERPASAPRAGSGEQRPRAGAAAVAVAAAAILAVAAFVATIGVPWRPGEFRRPGFGIGENIPVEALEMARSEGLKGRVFDTLAFGSYVTYAGWPDLRTFIDSRLEVFGGETIRRYGRIIREKDAFLDNLRASPFDLAILSWQLEPVSGACAALAETPSWALIYFDDLAMVWVNDVPATHDLASRRAYRILHPLMFTVGGGIPEGADPVEAEREARRAVAEVPALPGRPTMNAIARVMLGAALQRQGRHVEAASEFRASLAARPAAPAVYGMLGNSLFLAGDLSGAREAFLELKRRVPASRYADQMLREIDAAPPLPGP